MTADELTQRAQALCDGSLSLNEFKAWFSYTHPAGTAGQTIPDAEPAIPGDVLTQALAALKPDDQFVRRGDHIAHVETNPFKDKSANIKNALELSGFRKVQIQRADYGFAYEITADYQGKRVQRTITRPDIHLVVDLMRDEADG